MICTSNLKLSCIQLNPYIAIIIFFHYSLKFAVYNLGKFRDAIVMYHLSLEADPNFYDPYSKCV